MDGNSGPWCHMVESVESAYLWKAVVDILGAVVGGTCERRAGKGRHEMQWGGEGKNIDTKISVVRS